MTQTLKVEYEELLARAREIEVPLPAPPPANPKGPCALGFIGDAATQLALNADLLRQCIKWCEREYGRLAQSLRNAAKAYEEVDEGAAEAVASSFASAASSGSADGNDQMTTNFIPIAEPPNMNPAPPPPPPPPLPSPPPPPPPFEYPYYEVRQAATDIEAPDQGTAFNGFAKDWDSYQRKLQETIVRFRPFESWDGQSAMLVEANFQSHRSYIASLAQLCTQIASQANGVVSAHAWAVTQHPTSYEVYECDSWYKRVVTSTDPNARKSLGYYLDWYANMQKRSEDVLPEYRQRANLPLSPVNPQNPPNAVRIDAPLVIPDPGLPDGGIPDPGLPGGGIPDPGLPGGGIPDPGLPGGDIPDEGGTLDPGDPSGDLPYDGLPDSGYLPGSPAGGMPSTPSMPNDPRLADAAKRVKGMPTGAGVKPASFGGGGAGMPSLPSQPLMDAEELSTRATAASGAAGAGRGIPGAGSAAGGGGMGMAPMGAAGAHGKGQGQDGTGKSAQQDEDALYTEDRAWTEGVIGRRRAKDGPDK